MTSVATSQGPVMVPILHSLILETYLDGRGLWRWRICNLSGGIVANDGKVFRSSEDAQAAGERFVREDQDHRLDPGEWRPYKEIDIFARLRNEVIVAWGAGARAEGLRPMHYIVSECAAEYFGCRSTDYLLWVAAVYLPKDRRGKYDPSSKHEWIARYPDFENWGLKYAYCSLDDPGVMLPPLIRPQMHRSRDPYA